ncbi:MAG TPA: YqgE/AlgH family protein [Stellaceae bacterium]|jgi:putative transcriptional regulator|nr:YqgE/AlgH family protein [Stellaceae bacterium]
MTSLTGQLLVAMPQMTDPRFERSVVYVCAHSEAEGAMGLVINKLLASLTMDELLTHLKLEPSGVGRGHPVHFGGPVEPGRGFVLHSADYREEATLVVGDEFAITATLDILRAIGKGEGPRRSLLALGYAGWAPGQLDAEMQANGWLSVAADSDLVFDSDFDAKWQRALKKLGIDLTMLSTDAGHA